MPGAPGVLEFHIAASKEARGRWLTRRTGDLLMAAVSATPGCRTLATQIHSPLHANMLMRFGFDVTEMIAHRSVSS
jgi:hypothetical protein